MPSITPAELARRLEQPDPPVVVDVRTRQEYDEGHVPRAINVPFNEMGASAGDRNAG
jgi:rhodanese-related sulfurtransferase